MNDVSTNDASFRGRDEVDDVLDFRSDLQFTLYLFQSVSDDTFAVDETVSIVNEFDEVVAETVTAQAYEVDTAIACRLLACDDVGGHIHAKAASALYHHIAADTAELMAEHGSGDDGIVVDRHLTGELRRVANDTVVA